MNELENMHVLVTRPLGQAEHLCRLIEAEGGHAILLPTIEIQRIESTKAAWQLEKQDLAIFISPNAVTHLQQTLPTSLKIAAVGAGTGMMLTSAGLPVHYQPEHFSSEGLLALPELQRVNEKHIIIFKGEGGRDLLATTLQQRGAIVTEAVLYRRAMPKADLQTALPAAQREKLDIIICTSNTSVQNLVDMMNPDQKKWLFNMPLIVLSERTANFAHELGFVRMPIVSENATDEKIIEALMLFHKGKNTLWKKPQ